MKKKDDETYTLHFVIFSRFYNWEMNMQWSEELGIRKWKRTNCRTRQWKTSNVEITTVKAAMSKNVMENVRFAVLWEKENAVIEKLFTFVPFLFPCFFFRMFTEPAVRHSHGLAFSVHFVIHSKVSSRCIATLVFNKFLGKTRKRR